MVILNRIVERFGHPTDLAKDFGPDAQTAIAAANALVPGGFTAFSEWARKNMKPGG